MNYSRLVLAALGGTVVYFLFGGLVFGMLPVLRNEYGKYPAVYRPQEEMRAVMPVGLAATLIAILVLAVIYAMLYRGGSGLVESAHFGAHFGALIGVFAVCAFVIHNYVNLQIGLKLTVEQAVAYFVEWTLVGIVIGLIYRPAGP